MGYSAVLFDMDGTVTDSLADMHDSVNRALSEFALPEVSEDDVRRYVGNGARRLIEQAVPEGTEPGLTERVLEFYLPWYAAHCMIKTGPYSGIPELMRRLNAAGVRQVIVTNKPDSAASEIQERFFSDLAEFAVGEKPGIRRKPCPDMVDAAVERLGLEKSRCVYVGDSEVDITTARNAGMKCISVLWGFRNREELERAGAECFARSPEELYDLIISG